MSYLTIMWLLLLAVWLLSMALTWALMATSAQADRNAERIMELVDNQPRYKKPPIGDIEEVRHGRI